MGTRHARAGKTLPLIGGGWKWRGQASAAIKCAQSSMTALPGPPARQSERIVDGTGMHSLPRRGGLCTAVKRLAALSKRSRYARRSPLAGPGQGDHPGRQVKQPQQQVPETGPEVALLNACTAWSPAAVSASTAKG